jgi:uncharacterized lipoprotein YmbA
MKPIHLIGLWALVAMTGCSLSRGAPIQQHYVLGGELRSESAVPGGALTGVTVGVRRLQLASYLESPFIVIRRGGQEIQFSEFHRWGEPLGGGINDAVAAYLAAGAPFGTVDVAPWPLHEQYHYVVQLHILRFEGVAPVERSALEGEAHMLATWEIIQQRDGAVLARGTTEHRGTGWTVGDHAGLVGMLDLGLHALSADLVDRLASLGSAAALDAGAPRSGESPWPPPSLPGTP